MNINTKLSVVKYIANTWIHAYREAKERLNVYIYYNPWVALDIKTIHIEDKNKLDKPELSNNQLSELNDTLVF